MARQPARTREVLMHASTILPGTTEEVCLLCGQVWPCEEAPRTVLVEPLAPEPTPELVVASAVASNVPWRIVAAQMGVPEKAVQTYIDAEGGSQ